MGVGTDAQALEQKAWRKIMDGNVHRRHPDISMISLIIFTRLVARGNRVCHFFETTANQKAGFSPAE